MNYKLDPELQEKFDMLKTIHTLNLRKVFVGGEVYKLEKIASENEEIQMMVKYGQDVFSKCLKSQTSDQLMPTINTQNSQNNIRKNRVDQNKDIYKKSLKSKNVRYNLRTVTTVAPKRVISLQDYKKRLEKQVSNNVSDFQKVKNMINNVRKDVDMRIDSTNQNKRQTKAIETIVLD